MVPVHRELSQPNDDVRFYRPAFAPADLSDTARGIDLRNIVSVLVGKISWLLLAGLVGSVLGVAAGAVLPERYLSEGLLVIDTRELNIPEFQSIRSARSVEPWGARSEAEVLASSEMVSAIVTELDLQHDPHYNLTLREAPVLRWLSTIAWLPEAWRDELRPAPEFGPRIQTQIIQQIRKDLTVLSEERSYAITVRYYGYDPILSARLLNKLMDTYLSQDVRAKRRAVDQARDQLKQRLDYLHSDLEATQARIRSLEGLPGTLETQQGTITAQVASAVALERLRLAAERGGVETDLAQLDSGLANKQISVTNEKLVTPRLKELWEDESKLQRALGELGASYSSTSRVFARLRSGLASVQLEIRAEVAAIRGGLQQRVATLKLRGEALERQLSEARTVGSTSAANRALLSQLKGEATSKQALYDQYRNRYEQTVANAELLTPDARVVSNAVPANRPAYPSSLVRALIGGLIGLIASIGTIVARRWLGDRLETLDDAERICGVTALGGIPQVGGGIRRTSVTDLVLNEPASALSETIRGILYRIKCNPMMKSLKVIMVTSPLSQDGKSSLVAAMVRIGARDGMRCLAVDCDFHRPSLAHKIDARPKLYLNESIVGEPTLSDMVVEDPASGAHFIVAKPSSDRSGPLPQNAMRLRGIIEAARQEYDLIVIDTAPSLAVVDPLLLSQVADAMVLVLPWRTTTHRRAREAMQRLATFGCPLVGVVLSRIGGRAELGYGYLGYTPTKA